METEKIKTLIRNFHDELFNKSNLAVIDEFYAPNYTWFDIASDQKADFQGMKQQISQNIAAFVSGNMTNNHFVIDDIVVEGDRAAFRWTFTASDPQGQQIKNSGMSMYTFEGGKVVKDYSITNL